MSRESFEPLRASLVAFAAREAGTGLQALLDKATSLGLEELAIDAPSSFCVALEELARLDASLAVVFHARALARWLGATDMLAVSPFMEFRETRERPFLAEDSALPAYVPKGANTLALRRGSRWVRVAFESSSVELTGLRDCHFVDARPKSGAAEAPLTPIADLETRTNLAVASIALGLCRASLDEARAYALTRRQGGREIIHWSEVRMLLGSIQARVTLASSSLAHALETSRPELAAAACISLQELAPRIASDAIQVMGGAGYTREFLQERRFRDAFCVQALLGPLPMRKLALG